MAADSEEEHTERGRVYLRMRDLRGHASNMTHPSECRARSVATSNQAVRKTRPRSFLTDHALISIDN